MNAVFFVRMPAVIATILTLFALVAGAQAGGLSLKIKKPSGVKLPSSPNLPSAPRMPSATRLPSGPRSPSVPGVPSHWVPAPNRIPNPNVIPNLPPMQQTFLRPLPPPNPLPVRPPSLPRIVPLKIIPFHAGTTTPQVPKVHIGPNGRTTIRETYQQALSGSATGAAGGAVFGSALGPAGTVGGAAGGAAAGAATGAVHGFGDGVYQANEEWFKARDPSGRLNIGPILGVNDQDNTNFRRMYQTGVTGAAAAAVGGGAVGEDPYNSAIKNGVLSSGIILLDANRDAIKTTIERQMERGFLSNPPYPTRY